ncbi:MAG: SGNH/GDSL hydrolase family protein [Xanthobacteraceae bacterium]
MIHDRLIHRWTMKVGLAAAIVCVAGAACAQAPAVEDAKNAMTSAPAERCFIPQAEARFERALSRTAQRVTAGLPVKIVAIGSSSTHGAGATSKDATYPSRLAAYLADDLPNNDFTVVNRGVNGDTATEMLARFDQDVFAEKPDLVLWQVGTNSVLRGDPMQPHLSLLQTGLARLKQARMDVVLIDPQYAPRVIAKPNAKRMVSMIARTAKERAINVFHRFALMRHWREVAGLPFRTFLSPDQLHMNDWSYGCVARALGRAIAGAATRPMEIVGAARRPR